jgi:hypothetical protein
VIIIEISLCLNLSLWIRGQNILDLDNQIFAQIFAQIIIVLFSTLVHLKVVHKHDDNGNKENYIDYNTGYQYFFHRFVFLLLFFLVQNGVKSFLKSQLHFHEKTLNHCKIVPWKIGVNENENMYIFRNYFTPYDSQSSWIWTAFSSWEVSKSDVMNLVRFEFDLLISIFDIFYS